MNKFKQITSSALVAELITVMILGVAEQLSSFEMLLLIVLCFIGLSNLVKE